MRSGRRRCGINIGIMIAAFGIGLIVAFCCPKGMIIAFLAVALVIMGIAFGSR